MAAEQLTLFTWDTLVTPLPDGRVILTPRRVQRPSEYLTTAEVMRRTGLQKSQATVVMHTLGAQQRGRKCTLRLPAEALEKHLQRKAGGN